MTFEEEINQNYAKYMDEVYGDTRPEYTYSDYRGATAQGRAVFAGNTAVPDGEPDPIGPMAMGFYNGFVERLNESWEQGLTARTLLENVDDICAVGLSAAGKVVPTAAAGLVKTASGYLAPVMTALYAGGAYYDIWNNPEEYPTEEAAYERLGEGFGKLAASVPSLVTGAVSGALSLGEMAWNVMMADYGRRAGNLNDWLENDAKR